MLKTMAFALTLLTFSFAGCATINTNDYNKLRCERIRDDLSRAYFLTKESDLFGLSIALRQGGAPNEIIFKVLQYSNNAVAKAATDYQYETKLESLFGNILKNSDCAQVFESDEDSKKSQ